MNVVKQHDIAHLNLLFILLLGPTKCTFGYTNTELQPEYQQETSVVLCMCSASGDMEWPLINPGNISKLHK